jgi:hypothetical protein
VRAPFAGLTGTVGLDGDIARQAGHPPYEASQQASIKQEITLMAASRAAEPSWGTDEHGAFTGVLLSGLEGAASDLLGNVTALGLHAFAVSAFTNAWDQQPVLKCHHAFAPVLRRATPPIDREALLSIVSLFPAVDDTFALTPDHVGHRPIPAGETATTEQQEFDQLAGLRSVGLLKIDGAAMDLGVAATASLRVRLSALGRYYWELASRDLV